MIAVRDASSWFEDSGDTVTLVVLRRNWEMGGWEYMRSVGASREKAEEAYQAECYRRGDVSRELARRRQNWGPREL